MTAREFRLNADLSAFAGDQKIIASSVGPQGEACLLLVAPAFEKEPFGREEQKGFASFPSSKPKANYPATFIRFGGKLLERTELPEVDISFPSVQPLPNGEILLVGSRCHFRDGDPEKNAVVYNSDGDIVRRFVLGDGINDIQTTVNGMVWVSYFDEGVIGNFGWKKPIGAAGLVCFDSAGRIVWEFEPPAGIDIITDCYALNVAADTVWACYYTDFPLVRVDSARRVQAWKNNIGGANALAVNGKRVALWGGYHDKGARCVVQEMDGNSLVKGVKLPVSFPNGIEAISTRVLGRDAMLHAFVGNSWFVFGF